MAEMIVSNNEPQSIEFLVDGWLEQERNGVQFPVDFEIAWQIAGYATKASAKRKLSRFIKGLDFSTEVLKKGQRGRSSDLIRLTCDALKYFCLLAETMQGDRVREYFVETEKKWKLVEQHRPDVAQEIEAIKQAQDARLLEMQMQNENLRLETSLILAKKTLVDAETAQMQFRQTVVTTCPEPVAQKVLGYQTIKEIETRDRIIYDNQLINDGSTINKTELCRRYSFTTKSGAPDYRRLKKYLEAMPKESMTEVPTIRENEELRRDYLDLLDKLVFSNGDRQLFLVERY